MLKGKLLHRPKETDGAKETFETVLKLIDSAKESIKIHMYVWRSDEIGNRIGEALLRAAERGVEINITKDQSAMMYERIEMNRKSYLPREPSKLKSLWWKIIAPTFPDTFIEDQFVNGAGQKLIHHSNVQIEWIDKVHTHQKYYLIDQKHLITGSINIEDRHHKYFDYMAHLEQENLGEHFHKRESGQIPFNLNNKIEYIFNQPINGADRFEIKPLLIRLLKEAKREIYIESAYIGDPDIEDALKEASIRDVEINMLLSKKANIGNDNNYKRAEKIMKSGSARIFLTPKMIHSKMVAVDRETIFSGSANLSIFSMCNSGELNLLIKEPNLVKDFISVADYRKSVSQEVEDPEILANYNRKIAYLQELHQKLKL
ncbi:MAG: phosphatidylserine/phosphatidylglycerophosphate/cardiolipin synthase family protein [Verrucomicrobiaceae bacterium]|nr:MAG: phosphatidylserine/phosphatidylglycerophosphate/cardiolipin synthase family protein [Verrucomicrobiaceae bacterium]